MQGLLFSNFFPLQNNRKLSAYYLFFVILRFYVVSDTPIVTFYIFQGRLYFFGNFTCTVRFFSFQNIYFEQPTIDILFLPIFIYAPDITIFTVDTVEVCSFIQFCIVFKNLCISILL